MIRSLRGAVGFQARPAPVASNRLTHAVAASLAVGCLSLCVVLTLAVLSIRSASAMPF
ncbi:hypothetical protein [Rhodopseudomonas boonkerdii]|uniref:hypothetical protein n=1 Tax=Rhodopseudomonas boonkerdii TaxID=475937 RepID=UPI001E5104F0|nr:hypothetical protein [Rhodopseudomonas boonkerdii]